MKNLKEDDRYNKDWPKHRHKKREKKRIRDSKVQEKEEKHNRNKDER